MRAWSISSERYTIEGEKLHDFLFHSDFVLERYNQTLKVCQNLFIGWRNGTFKIGNSKCSSSNVYVSPAIGQSRNSNYRHMFASKDQKICSNWEKFELMNFELSEIFCWDLIANAHGTQRIVRIIGSSYSLPQRLVVSGTKCPQSAMRVEHLKCELLPGRTRFRVFAYILGYF